MLIYKNGDVLQAKEKYIAHQVNCLGVMGAGLARQVANRYPHVNEIYRQVCVDNTDKQSLLGKIQIAPCDVDDVSLEKQCIINVFGQLNTGVDQCQTDYDALKDAFTLVNELKVDIAIPYLFGCGLAGGDWTIVTEIIESTCPDINVNIYKFDASTEAK